MPGRYYEAPLRGKPWEDGKMEGSTFPLFAFGKIGLTLAPL